MPDINTPVTPGVEEGSPPRVSTAVPNVISPSDPIPEVIPEPPVVPGQPATPAVPTTPPEPVVPPTVPPVAPPAPALPADDPAAVVPIQEGVNGNIRAVQSLLAAAKCTNAQAQAIFGEALDAGDISLVKTADLQALLGETNAALAMAAVKAYHADELAPRLEVIGKLKTAFGTEEMYKQAESFFVSREKDPAVMVLADMLGQGGYKAELAIQEMYRMYTSDPSTVVGALPVSAAAGAPVSGLTGELLKSRAEFSERLSKARTQGEKEAVLQLWHASKPHITR